MAKASVELSKVATLPAIPEGCELIQAERTLSGVKIETEKDGKKVVSSPSGVVSVIVPKEGNAEGLRNWIAYRSELGKLSGNGDTLGVSDAINAIRSEAFNIVPKLTAETAKESEHYLLPFTGPRTIDPFEAVTAKVGEFMRDKGRMPTPQEYGAIVAELQKK